MIAFIIGFLLAGAWSGSVWVGLIAGSVCGVAAVLTRPWTSCWWCGSRGGPRRMDRSGRNWRHCWVCKGSGKRLRVLAQLVRGGR